MQTSIRLISISAGAGLTRSARPAKDGSAISPPRSPNTVKDVPARTASRRARPLRPGRTGAVR
jgi:hypothetical protein